MARIVEDIGSESASDDEFPSVQELVATRGKRVVGARARVRSASTREDEGAKVGKLKSPVKKHSTKGEKEVADGGVGGGKGKAKKRVLNQKSDNPLLRPFDGASSELLGEGSRRKGRTLGVKMGKNLVEKDDEALLKESPRDHQKSEPSSENLMESAESDNDDEFSQVRKTKTQAKTTKAKQVRKPKDEETKDKESERTLSTPVESIEPEDQDVSQVRKIVKSRQVRKAVEKARAESPPKIDSEEQDFGLDSDGLSDFIVDDSTFLEEEDTVIEEPAPRSVRRLVKGRKPNRVEESDDEDLDLRMGKLKMEGDASNTLDKALKELNLDDSDDEDLLESKTKKRSKDIQSKVPGRFKNDKAPPASSDIEDPFTLRYSPSMNKPIKVPKETRFATPPGSPELKPRGLVSPKKKFPRIPSTPHRPNMDSFWQQDVVNDWNDEYSPRKVIYPQPHFKADGSIPIDPRLLSPKKSAVKQDRVSKEAKKSFAQQKHALAEAFLLELDTKVTNGEISRLAEETGGVKIIWSKKLNSTAGRANWKRETVKSKLNPHLPHYRHHASIELAEKVIDDESRLLNTIAHEFCHLTTFMIDNMKTNPHGKEFKAWGAKVTRMFGHRGIEVTTKHSYEIDYKYVWECENCGIEFKRHSKSIDPDRQRCGTCKSRLFQTKPVPRAGKENGGKEKGLGEYQMFVKENMSRVREENPGSPQKEIMSLVGKKYQEFKASKMNGSVATVEVVDIVEEVGSREITPEQERAAFVSRKLDFLDLTRE